MQYEQIPLSSLVADYDQNFRTEDRYADDAFNALVASIKRNGVLEPLVVTETDDGTYMVVAGHRRFAALNTLNKGKDLDAIKVPVIVRSVETDHVRREIALHQAMNVPFSPMEEARMYSVLKNDLAMSLRDIAATVGRSVEVVEKSLSLLHLPEDIQALVNSGDARKPAACKLGELVGKYSGDEKVIDVLCGVMRTSPGASLADFSRDAAVALTNLFTPSKGEVTSQTAGDTATPTAATTASTPASSPVKESRERIDKKSIQQTKIVAVLNELLDAPEHYLRPNAEVFDDLKQIAKTGSDLIKIEWLLNQLLSRSVDRIFEDLAESEIETEVKLPKTPRKARQAVAITPTAAPTKAVSVETTVVTETVEEEEEEEESVSVPEPVKTVAVAQTPKITAKREPPKRVERPDRQVAKVVTTTEEDEAW